MPGQEQKVAIFLHSGEYDRLHQGLSIAAAAVAEGRPVDIFFFWWALERLISDQLDEPDFGPERDPFSNRFESRGLPTVRELLAHVRESGLSTLHACTGSLAVVADNPSGMDRLVDGFVGWSAILRLTRGVVDRFYL